jgi:hypothetical protein
MAKKKTAPQFLLCIDNRAYPASLEARKVYSSVPDAAAAAHGLVRVIDESGEDYLYPASRFVSIEVPGEAAAAFGEPAETNGTRRTARRRSSTEPRPGRSRRGSEKTARQ